MPRVKLPFGSEVIASLVPRKHPFRWRLDAVHVLVGKAQIRVSATDTGIAALWFASRDADSEIGSGYVQPGRVKDGAIVEFAPLDSGRFPPIADVFPKRYGGPRSTVAEMRKRIRESPGDVVPLPGLYLRKEQSVPKKEFRRVVSLVAKLGGKELRFCDFYGLVAIQVFTPQGELRIVTMSALPTP